MVNLQECLYFRTKNGCFSKTRGIKTVENTGASVAASAFAPGGDDVAMISKNDRLEYFLLYKLYQSAKVSSFIPSFTRVVYFPGD